MDKKSDWWCFHQVRMGKAPPWCTKTPVEMEVWGMGLFWFGDSPSKMPSF